MKSLLFLFLFTCACVFCASAQSFRGLDRSPMDMAYLPDNFAHDRKEGDQAIIRVTYSRPQKKGRDLFGGLLSYGKVWRVGANEAPEINVYQDITLGGKKLQAGTYSLFAIPGEKEWEIIINSDLNYWGAYSYDSAKDIIRIITSVRSLDQVVEAFSLQFQETGSKQATMRLAWDQTMVEVPITY
ncbi:MAG: DUF2911 domain-containing protein [Bacteroidota bacterium]